MNKYPKGFTIVELLVVIVVIGVLAAITIVSFSSTSAQARNASRISAASHAIELMQTVLSYNTSASVIATMNLEDVGYYNACVGKGLVDRNADGKGDCGVYNGTVYAKQSATFDTLVSSVSALPDMAKYPASTATDGDVVYGPFFETLIVDSVARFAMEYGLEGTGQKCSLGPLVYGGSPYTLTKPGGAAANYTSSGSGVTGCIVYVANQ